MKKYLFVFIILVISLAGAGCASQTTPTDTDTPVTLPTNTLVPTVTKASPETTIELSGVEIKWVVADLNTYVGSIRSVLKNNQKNLIEAFNKEYAGKIYITAVTYQKGMEADILGPARPDEAQALEQDFLDLGAYIQEADLSNSMVGTNLLNAFTTDNGVIALPFCLAATTLVYQPASFDAAGLNYPPAAYGEKYVMPDGSEVEWSFDTLAEVARLLNMGKNGLAYYPLNIRYSFSPFGDSASGAGISELSADERGEVLADWLAAWQWLHNGYYSEQPFMSDYSWGETREKHAMILADSGAIGDMRNKSLEFAALPSYNGVVLGQVADISTMFFIFKNSEHPQEAFTVLKYMYEHDEAEALCNIHYGSGNGNLPAVERLVDAHLEEWGKLMPAAKNMAILTETMNYIAPSSVFWESKDNQAIIHKYFTMVLNDANVDMNELFRQMEAELAGK